MKNDLMAGLYANLLSEKEQKQKDKKLTSTKKSAPKKLEKTKVISKDEDMAKNAKKEVAPKTKTEAKPKTIEKKVETPVKKAPAKKRAVKKTVAKTKPIKSMKDEEPMKKVVLQEASKEAITSQYIDLEEIELEEEKMASSDLLKIEAPIKKIAAKPVAKSKKITKKKIVKKDKVLKSKKIEKETKLEVEDKQPKSSTKKKLSNLFKSKHKTPSLKKEKPVKVKKTIVKNKQTKSEKEPEETFAISFKGIQKSFGSKSVLKDFNLDIKEGESYVLLGRSGVGKSVSIKIANGLIPADKGSVSLFGKKLGGFFSMQLFSRLYKINEDISFLFQGSALFDSMNILENVAFGLIESKNYKRDAAFAIAREKLSEVDLDPDDIGFKYPSELSGGMKRRVALARAIATKPKIIFFDEPTTGLDPITSDVINSLIIKSIKKIGATAITITHDIHSAKLIADRIGLLNNGKLEWEGKPKDLKTSKNEIIKGFIKNEKI